MVVSGNKAEESAQDLYNSLTPILGKNVDEVTLHVAQLRKLTKLPEPGAAFEKDILDGK